MKPERLSGLEVLLATVMLAGVFIAGDVAVIDVNPVLVAALRFVAAAVVLVGVLTALRLGGRIDARGWGLILACGLSGVFLYNAFFFYGLKLSNVSHGAAIIATIPILVALIESAWNRSLPARHQMVGAALAFLGVLVIVEYSAFFGDLSTVTASTPAGDLAFLLAALCFAGIQLCLTTFLVALLVEDLGFALVAAGVGGALARHPARAALVLLAHRTVATASPVAYRPPDRWNLTTQRRC